MTLRSLIRGLKALTGCMCLVLSAIIPAQAQSPAEHWRVVRDFMDRTAGVNGISATDDGHLITVGALYTPDGKGGISVSKLRLADGSTVWRSELLITKPPAVASVRDFAVDRGGNAYVICTHSKGTTLAKFLASGKIAWKKNLKGGVRAITLDSQGNPAVFHMAGSLKAGFSSNVTKFSSAKGGVLWKATVAQAIPRSSAPDVQDLEFDAAGNLIVAMGGVDNTPSRCVKLEASKGRLVWQRQFNTGSGEELGIGQIAVDSDGDVVVSASRAVDAFYQWGLTAKVSGADGSHLWGNAQYTTASLLHMGFDSAGRLDRIYRTSNLSNAQLVISKSNGDTGTAIWTVQNPGAQPPGYSVMSVDSGPNGEIALLTNGGTEAWIHFLDPSGKLLWAGANKPENLSLSVNAPYNTGLMNRKQIVALGDSVVMACSRTNFPMKQQDFAKYGTPLPGDLVVRTAAGEDWESGSSYRLGDVDLRLYDYFNVTIHNGGEGDLVLGNFRIFGTRRIDVYSGDEFQIEGNGASQLVPPGGDAQIRIRFYPKEAGLCTASLEMNSNDPDLPSISIPISGRGMGPEQEFGDWAVAHGMPETISPDHAPHGDGIPLVLKFAFNLDPTRADHQVVKRDSGLAGLPLVTFEKKPGSNENWFRIEYLKRRDTKINYQAVRSRAPGGPYESVNFSELKVTLLDAEWERVVGWCQRSSDKPQREFVRLAVTF